MKISYFPETDSLYISLSVKKSVESEEISTGVVIDYDGEKMICGIDIDNASKKLDLKELILNKLPIQNQVIAS